MGARLATDDRIADIVDMDVSCALDVTLPWAVDTRIDVTTVALASCGLSFVRTPLKVFSRTRRNVLLGSSYC